jgi:hypothetical protein
MFGLWGWDGMRGVNNDNSIHSFHIVSYIAVHVWIVGLGTHTHLMSRSIRLGIEDEYHRWVR